MLTNVNNVDEVRFIFNQNRWSPTTTTLGNALRKNNAKGKLREIPGPKRDELFNTRDIGKIINMLVNKHFDTLIRKI